MYSSGLTEIIDSSSYMIHLGLILQLLFDHGDLNRGFPNFLVLFLGSSYMRDPIVLGLGAPGRNRLPSPLQVPFPALSVFETSGPQHRHPQNSSAHPECSDDYADPPLLEPP